jgi:hypothetical protein
VSILAACVSACYSLSGVTKISNSGENLIMISKEEVELHCQYWQTRLHVTDLNITNGSVVTSSVSLMVPLCWLPLSIDPVLPTFTKNIHGASDITVATQ